MHGRINNKSRIFASILLLGYLSFVLLSITHFHSAETTCNSNLTSQFASDTSFSKTPKESADNCPICHLYSSINFCLLTGVIAPDLTVQSKISLNNKTGYKFTLSEMLFPRGPPVSISFSI